MKKLLTILLGSFALASVTQAQQAEETPAADTKHSGKGHGKERSAEAQPANKANPAKEARPTKEARPAREARRQAPEAPPREAAQTAPEARHSTKSESAPKKHAKTPAAPESAPEAPAATAESKAPDAPAGKHKKNHDAPAEAKPATKDDSAAPERNTSATPPAARNRGKAARPDARTIEKIKTQHATFRAEPKPDRVPTVTFTQHRQLEGSDQWQGEKYGVYRSYRPERHDEGYYRKHYQRVELISGGYYYYNEGYWYPAWGYDNSHEYYAYDAPIYAGHRAEPLDRVIADVQAILQEQGYYTGEVDGLLGPLTREALVGYQGDNGLYRTAVIDEPTLSSLGLE
ncbi:MAG: peptidoglycan-binding protein [Chthoniobacterales bacterium]